MPYRTELRRPDLKGTFRCSLCNKIFCHSSSLSRHRMQAHFKSYTCTLCNKEITSNETLRAHMFKNHKISRMFMCRCCNWAFPDKTSLHIHMQSMVNGNPGNVSIIAKSSITPPPQMPNGLLENGSGIFPTIPLRNELLMRLQERAMMGSIHSSALDLCTLFPFDKMLASAQNAEGTEDKNNNKVGIRLFSSDSESVTGEDMDVGGQDSDMDQKSIGTGTAASGQGSASDELVNEHDAEKDDAAETENGEDAGNGKLVVVKEETMETGEKESDVGNDDELEPNRDSYTDRLLKLNQQASDLPVLRSAISASPLNTLLYQKKLNSVLRNKHLDRSMHSFFYPSQFAEQAMHNAQLALALTIANQLSASGAGKSPSNGQGEQASTNGEETSSYASPNDSCETDPACYKDGSIADSRSSVTPTLTSACSTCASATTTMSNSTNSTSVCTSTSSTSVSSSSVASASTPTPTDSAASTMCFECQVLRGRLAQSENRCRFLERKTSTQESKIARLETRIGTLEANGRRYESETQLLKEHCERLELRVLECQQRALLCLQNQRLKGDADETSSQLLVSILESCSYK